MYRLGFSVFKAACFLIIAGVLMVSCSDDDKAGNPVTPATLQGEWAPLGSGIGIGESGQGSALAVLGDTLILGGAFSSIDSVAANNIAAWDGSSWTPLGSGISGGPVRTLTTFMGLMIVGGEFDRAGGVSADNIAIWNGSSWSAFDTGRDQAVFALIVYKNVFFAGGNTGVNGGLSFNFDLTNWQTLDPNMYILAFTIFNDELVIGGSFSTVGDDQVNNIVAFDVSMNIASLGSGIGGTVYALAVYQGKLIAGGALSSAGGVSVNNIAAWDGSAWAPLGRGVNSTVNGLTVFDDKLIACGQFLTADGISANHIAAWDGLVWKSLGSGADAMVRTVASYGNKLIAAGNFTTAGGVNAGGIAAWTPR